MKLEELLLKREEIPIGGYNREFSSPACIVPIHHSLRDHIPDNIKYDRELAYSVMNETIDWYVEDLKEYYEQLVDLATKQWVEKAFLDRLPEKRDDWGESSPLGGGWIVYMVLSQNFLYSLGLTVHCHLYADTGSFVSDDINSTYARFTKEKFIEFSKDGDVREDVRDFGRDRKYYFCRAYAWHQHNVDIIPEAIMLRDWAILYENLLLRLMNERGLLEFRT